MSIWRRSTPTLPAGIYDEVVSEALELRLAALKETHAVDLADVGKGTAVDAQLVTLIRDAARIAIEAKGDAAEKIALARGLLERLGHEAEPSAGRCVSSPPPTCAQRR